MRANLKSSFEKHAFLSNALGYVENEGKIEERKH